MIIIIFELIVLNLELHHREFLNRLAGSSIYPQFQLTAPRTFFVRPLCLKMDYGARTAPALNEGRDLLVRNFARNVS